MRTSILFILCLLLPLFTHAADIYVNNSGQPGTYTTIMAAITAANSGDNIYISPYSAYTETISIDKSISLISAVSGTYFNVIGNITVTGFGSGEVKLIGLSISGDIIGDIGSSTLNNETEVYIIDSHVNSMVYFFNAFHIKVHIYYSKILNQVLIYNGDIIGNTFEKYLRVYDGPNVGIGDTVRIIGNYFNNSYLQWSNDDHYFFIANNCFEKRVGQLDITKHHYNSIYNNMVINNTFIPIASYIQNNQGVSGSGTVTISTSTVSQANIHFINNLTARNEGNGVTITSSNAALTETPQLFYNLYYGSPNCQLICGNVSSDASVIVAPLERCLDSIYVLNKGLPSLEYYDIDMTINDIGIHGGPYSIDNYQSTAVGKARVYDLEMPFEIWNGQTPQVKAKAVHTK
jgi:hypothetical protein